MLTADRSAIIDQLKSMFVRVKEGEVDLSKVDETATFAEDLGMDSLDLLELRFEMESKWGLTLTDEEALQLKSVRDVVDLVLSHGT